MLTSHPNNPHYNHSPTDSFNSIHSFQSFTTQKLSYSADKNFSHTKKIQKIIPCFRLSTQNLTTRQTENSILLSPDLPSGFNEEQTSFFFSEDDGDISGAFYQEFGRDYFENDDSIYNIRKKSKIKSNIKSSLKSIRKSNKMNCSESERKSNEIIKSENGKLKHVGKFETAGTFNKEKNKVKSRNKG